MSSFQARKAYDASRRAQKTATPSAVTSRPVRHTSEEKKTSPPTYGFVDKQKGPNDVEADESSATRESIKDVAGNKDEDKVDKADFVPPVTTTTRPPKVVTTGEKNISDNRDDIFTKMWTPFYDLVVPPVVEPKRSSFVPVSTGLMNVLAAMENVLNGNEYLKYSCPHYFSLPVRLYYGVIFYLQILKAKEAAGVLGKAEGSWYRGFKRTYALESLPVAGPLVPVFSNITAVKPNDAKFDMIFPDYHTSQYEVKGSDEATPVFSTTSSVEHIHCPSVPFLTSMLRDFSRLTLAQLKNKVGQVEDHFDEDGNYVPFPIGKASSFAGVPFPTTPSNAVKNLLVTSFLDFPLPETKDMLTKILPFWKKSLATEIPAITVPGRNETLSFRNIGTFMSMEDDYSWFECCVDMATEQARFFHGSTNMSTIPAVGGNEVLIEMKIHPKANDFVTPDNWFPHTMTSMRAEFRTTRPDTEHEHFMNAAVALTNATFTWRSGSPDDQMSGELCHKGPYWRYRNYEFELETPTNVGHRTLTSVKTQFFDYKGKASQ